MEIDHIAAALRTPQFNEEERRWIEIRAQRRPILAEKEVVVLEIDGDKVEVRQGERGLTWSVGGKQYTTAHFWPDEPVGTIGENPTFYRVAKKYGLKTYLPAGYWWRKNEARANNKAPQEESFIPEE